MFIKIFAMLFFCIVEGGVIAEKVHATSSQPTQPQLSQLQHSQSQSPQPQVFISRFNTPKYAPGFENFAYVNVHAPKGGRVVMGTIGTFDSLNKDIVKGIPAHSLLMTADPLMKSTIDDPHSVYPLIAEKVTVAPDASFVIFHLNPKARFHDDSPITATDVQFTIELLGTQGLPRYRSYFHQIEKITVIDLQTIRFDLKKINGEYDRELPTIIAKTRILSQKSLAGIDFASSGLTPILGSGPYKVGAVSPGRSIVYERVKNYWAADLPVNKGQYNFDEIMIDYYKNAQAQFEAFKAGEFDCFFEPDQKQWHTAYNFTAIKDGRVKQVRAEHQRPVSVHTFIFNLRRPIFQDLRVRKALNYAYDFETFNKMYCHGAYHRMTSLFANTHFVSTEPPQGIELDYLLPYKDKLPPEIFSQAFSVPTTKGNGDQRENLKIADQLLNEAGWVIKDGKRVFQETGQPMVIEFMLKDSRLEKVVLAYKKSLAQLGIVLNVRMVDVTQYEKRAVEKDFDMIIHTWTNSLSPGIEQKYYFCAESADQPGSSNYIGVKDVMYEKLATHTANARSETELNAAVRALDRVVMGTYLMIPVFYDNQLSFSYWADRLSFPTFDKTVGTNVLEWWWSNTAANGGQGDPKEGQKGN